MATSVLQHGLDKIPDAQGYLVMNVDGAVLTSSGDLQNDENTAAIILNMLRTASRVPLSGDQTQKFKRMSVHFGDFALMATVSNQKVFVVKRQLRKEE